MIATTSKRKGGRPCLPPAPQTADACRALIAAEVVKQNPRTRTLQQLYRLLKSFVAAEEAARDDERNRLLSEEIRIKRAFLELKRDEYRRRRELGIARREATTATTEVGVESVARRSGECTT